MKYVDIENWTRKKQFHFFKGMDYPHFNICANVDVSSLHAYLKERNYSFFKTMIYIASRAANSVKEFRYRIRDGQVVEHELVHPSFTLLTTEDAFSFCTVQYTKDIKEFYQAAQLGMDQLKGGVNIDDEAGR